MTRCRWLSDTDHPPRSSVSDLRLTISTHSGSGAAGAYITSFTATLPGPRRSPGACRSGCSHGFPSGVNTTRPMQADAAGGLQPASGNLVHRAVIPVQKGRGRRESSQRARAADGIESLSAVDVDLQRVPGGPERIPRSARPRGVTGSLRAGAAAGSGAKPARGRPPAGTPDRTRRRSGAGPWVPEASGTDAPAEAGRCRVLPARLEHEWCRT